MLTLTLCAALVCAQEKKGETAVELTTKAKDVRVVSDRKETILDYFRRNRLFVGSLSDKEVTKLLAAKGPADKVFFHYASHNHEPDGGGSTFGAIVKVAPMPKDVADLIDKHKPDGKKKLRLTLVLRRDEKEAGLVHVVGCADRTPVGFFDDDKKVEADGFSQKEMRHRPVK